MNSFASLSIKRAAVLEKEKDRYLIISHTGEKKIVAASTAADAVEISGFKDVKRVANLAYEAEQILEKGVLANLDETFETRITLEEELIEFNTADLLDEARDEEAFVEYNLIEFAALNHVEASKPEIAIAPEPESVASIEAEPVVEQPEPKPVQIIDAPVEHPLQQSEKQLSEADVEALLKPE
ncbi:MAG: hypothetical protein U1E36_04485 [Rickettsiales bacterium]